MFNFLNKNKNKANENQKHNAVQPVQPGLTPNQITLAVGYWSDLLSPAFEVKRAGFQEALTQVLQERELQFRDLTVDYTVSEDLSTACQRADIKTNSPFKVLKSRMDFGEDGTVRVFERGSGWRTLGGNQ